MFFSAIIFFKFLSSKPWIRIVIQPKVLDSDPNQMNADPQLCKVVFFFSRLHKERVFYVSEKIMKQAANVARENLISLGMYQRESRRGTGSVVDPVGSASFCRSGIGIVLPDPDWERTRICIYFNEK
jgi:hypothetical protein